MNENNACRECDNFKYIGAGCFLCEILLKVVVDDGRATEDYFACEGKDFIEI